MNFYKFKLVWYYSWNESEETVYGIVPANSLPEAVNTLNHGFNDEILQLYIEPIDAVSDFFELTESMYNQLDHYLDDTPDNNEEEKDDLIDESNDWL